MTTQGQDVQTHLRTMARRDLPEVLAIEAASFAFPWEDEDFLWHLRRRNCVGAVAEAGDGKGKYGRIAGYMVYEFDAHCFRVCNLAVHPDCRRRGVGAGMLRALQQKLRRTGRRLLVADVSETTLAAHLFLRACGLRAVAVERCVGESYYRFQCEA
jgi:ribosomal-protein-alanine N-acetyltransferase